MPINVVGRSTEAEEVVDFLDAVLGEPSALVVEGEPGIGKTTLWLSALEQARERGFRVLSARPSAAESVLAYTGLADLLSAVDAAALTELPAPQRVAMDRILLLTEPDNTPTDLRAVCAAFLSVLEVLAEDTPVLLAIDDLQWLDASSGQVVAFAIRRIVGSVGILVAVRDDPESLRAVELLRLGAPDRFRRITIGPLSVGALHTVISDRLKRSLSRPVMMRIHEISGGNPLYAIELARALDGRAASVDVGLPNTLAGLVHARVGDLAPQPRDMLLAAACLATPTVELVARATGVDVERVVEALADAENNGVVTIAGNRLGFTHPLLAAGVYTDATTAKRRWMHRRLADLVDQPELKARHLALGVTDADGEVLQSLDAAAGMAMVRGAPSAAAELLELAIGLGGDTAQRRIMLGGFLFNSGDGARAADVLDEVLAGPAPARLRAQALNLLAVMHQLEDNPPQGADYLERALRDAGDDVELRVQILVSLAWIQVHIGRFAASAQSIDAAVADAERLGRPQLLAQALGTWVVVHVLVGDGLDDRKLGRALEFEEHRTSVSVMFRPTVHNAMALAWTGELDAAHEQFLAIRQSCIERGEESELVFVSYHGVLNEIWRGDFVQASLIAEDTVERARLLKGPLPLGAALTIRALVAAYAGRADDVRRDFREAIGPISRSGSQLLKAWTIAAGGFLEVSLGNYRGALGEFEPVLDQIRAEPTATEIFVAGCVPDAAEALIQLGRLTDAEGLVDLLEDNGRRLDRPWMLAVGGRCRAMLLAADGDVRAATVVAQQAMAEHHRLPMPFERARTQLLLGQLYRRQRQRNAASIVSREALGTFETLNTPLWAARARTELARTDGGAGRAKLLTAGESRVAEFAASGMSNRDVAAALFISPKTVEVNLTRIYRKLGVRTRGELMRRIDELGM
ncbi:LuxR family transcriptional regulator [Mycobacterium sp. 1245805.9]|uniref:helix-turn-helix transcriptional regulator n=1 Tax=Mycobacterium sp. 1245805.9 TaxID=1856862 RepID=UPI0007FF504D|nr:LuxR family transcriptional regulator [Mycobacterium sp. 1245805.9]OBI81785.1 LuxR family transcriptional regulator [Mycobacterium sp. 1245805.9]